MIVADPHSDLGGPVVDVSEASSDSGLQDKMQAQGIIPRNTAMGDFDAYIRTDMSRLSPLLKEIADKR